jgi:hypothetical protein
MAARLFITHYLVKRFFGLRLWISAFRGSKKRKPRGAPKQKRRKQQLLIEAAATASNFCCSSYSRSSKVKSSRGYAERAKNARPFWTNNPNPRL